MDTHRSDLKAVHVRSVKRAFADALLAELCRSGLGRDKAAKSGGISRACLQLLLKAERQTTLGTLISIAEGIGVQPELLFSRTIENLRRIRAHRTTFSPRAAYYAHHDTGEAKNRSMEIVESPLVSGSSRAQKETI